MAEHDKTEPPTPRRLSEARRKGHSWWSRDLSSAAVLLTVALLVWLHGHTVADRLLGLVRSVFGSAFSPEPPAPQAVLAAGLSTAAWCLLPLLGATAVVGALVTFVQARPHPTLEPIRPRLDRLDPVSGLRRMLGRRPMIDVALALAKVIAIGLVLAHAMLAELGTLAGLSHVPVATAGAAVGRLAIRLLAYGGTALLALSAIDLVHQRRRYMNELRMTRREVQQETREAEGDQSIKAERRRLHQEVIDRATLHRLREADVVVVNPDHLAVALRYRPDRDDAPVVVAKGERLLARRIIEEARRLGIPVMRNVEVARSLARLETGEPIPEELYEAVAQILRFVESQGARGEP